MVCYDSTNVKPANMIEANMISFIEERGIVMSMLNANEIEEGEFVDYSLSKELITLLLELNEDEV